jgi:hypothetical protein
MLVFCRTFDVTVGGCLAWRLRKRSFMPATLGS